MSETLYFVDLPKRDTVVEVRYVPFCDRYIDKTGKTYRYYQDGNGKLVLFLNSEETWIASNEFLHSFSRRTPLFFSRKEAYQELENILIERLNLIHQSLAEVKREIRED